MSTTTNGQKKDYVNNAALLRELNISREQDKLTDNAVQMFMIMTERLAKNKTWPYPEEKEDCKQSAMLDVCLYWRSFDPSKSENPNPFAYFTSLIANGITKGWHKLHPKAKKGEPMITVSIDNNIYSI